MKSALFIRMSATVFVQPLDLVKNRMQLSGKNMVLLGCVHAFFMKHVSGLWIFFAKV